MLLSSRRRVNERLSGSATLSTRAAADAAAKASRLTLSGRAPDTPLSVGDW
jgi:hypothetical protein